MLSLLLFCFILFVQDHNIIPLQNTCDQGGYGVKTGEQQTFEMVKGRGHTLESVKGGGHQTLGSVKEGGGQTMMDTCRYSYSEWHNFTHPRLGEVSILKLIFFEVQWLWSIYTGFSRKTCKCARKVAFWFWFHLIFPLFCSSASPLEYCSFKE